MNQCIAQTRHDGRCKRKTKENKFFCFQHENKVKKISRGTQLSELKQIVQSGGWLDIPMTVPLPSCYDVLNCDWTTDMNAAVPGLSSIIQLISYK